MGIFLAVFASAYNPVRNVFLCVNWVRAEVEVSEVQCGVAYSVPYMDAGGYALQCHEGTGGTYQAGIFHLDAKGFREVELAGEARGEGNCKS
eukprot:3679341-Alexandrium_andersonii.AAC.1